MAAVTIRAATFEDLPVCRDLFRQLVHERPYTYPTIDGDELDAFVRMVAVQLQHGAPLFTIFVANILRNVVGMMAVEIGERAVGRPHRVVNVHWLYVVPDWRGMGVATRLIAHGVDWLTTTHPDVTHTEFFAAADDPQWLNRGFRPFLVRYAAPVADVADWRRPIPNGHDPEGLEVPAP